MTVEQTDRVREKTITWQDPRATAEQGAKLAGLDYLTAVAHGELPGPPISSHFGMRWLRVEAGDVLLSGTLDESLYNPIGTVHGGVAATLLDSAVACAVHSTLPAGVGYTSVELKVNYVRAIHGSLGEIFAHGWLVKGGARVAFAEGDLRAGDGKLLATASSTCLVVRP